MRQVEEKISAINIVDIAVVAVGPAMRPRIDDFEVVTAVREVRTASHDSHMPDGKVMLAAEVIVKVSVVNAAHMLVVPFVFVMSYLVVMSLFLTLLFLMVIVLSDSRHRSHQQKRNANGPNYNPSLHVETSF
jgi:VIT1/CCC1 family predicted Fe2+/Mn2+ transporter